MLIIFPETQCLLSIRLFFTRSFSSSTGLPTLLELRMMQRATERHFKNNFKFVLVFFLSQPYKVIFLETFLALLKIMPTNVNMFLSALKSLHCNV